MSKLDDIYKILSENLVGYNVSLGKESVVIHYSTPGFDDELNYKVRGLLGNIGVETWMGYTNGVSGWICVVPKENL